MSNNVDPEQSRSADQERARSIVQYLLARLEQNCPENISQSELTRHLYSETEPVGTRNSRYRSLQEIKKLTTAELIELIGRINQAILSINQRHRNRELPAAQLLAPEEILMLLQQLIQLKPEEKQRLNILKGAEETLLQQALLNMRLYYSPQDYERVLNFYCESINLTDAPETTEFSLEELYRQIPQILTSYTRYLPPVSTNFTQDVIDTVCREINKILIKSGTQQSQFWNTRSRAVYIKRYLTPGFVKRLTQAVAENKLLLEDFPIHIKKIVEYLRQYRATHPA